jgi:hypothetical protein
MAERTPNPVFDVVPDDILQVKIADLGNACWTVCLKRISIFYLSSLLLASTFYRRYSNTTISFA